MDNNLTKSLTDLIDETLMELDELRKSRFAATEIKIEGPGDGIAGKPSDGKLDASKAEDKKEDDKEEKEDEAKKGENETAAKGENEEAAKAEDKKEDEDKKDKDAKGGDEHEAKERKAIGELADLAGMKKSLEDSESLMKSYVEQRVAPLEEKLTTILDLVNKIADQPVAPKGQTYRAAPLMKSADEGVEPLSKAQVANKLFELKKSGTKVDSMDIVKAEMGQELQQIAKKYEIS